MYAPSTQARALVLFPVLSLLVSFARHVFARPLSFSVCLPFLSHTMTRAFSINELTQTQNTQTHVPPSPPSPSSPE